ncbi:hypothetical protein K438DRAFT_1777942 [Mycena galopus ATCC 62051]|nr:hypothetical protein K438DRAFT_1777942 [Mycena galopus ATCC 62051]
MLHQKSEPPRHGRLNFNSVFPIHHCHTNTCWVDYLHHLRRSRMMGSFSISPGSFNSGAPNPDSDQLNTSAAPHDNDEFLNTEDLALHSSDVQRWVVPKYEMQFDELLLFVEFFNNSTAAIEQGTIFLCGPSISYFANKLRELDWTQSISPEELRQAGMTTLANLISMRAHARHWTTVYHALRTPQPHLVLYNSKGERPEAPPPPDDRHDHLILNLFFRDSHPPIPPDRVHWVINPLYLGLQHDSYTCGFWVVYIGFSLILGFDMVNNAITSMDIKELVGPIYVSFIMDPLGVPASLIHVLFSVFRPSLQLGHLPSDLVFSQRPTHAVNGGPSKVQSMSNAGPDTPFVRYIEPS